MNVRATFTPRTIALAGLMAALTAVGGWLSLALPMSPVPVTGQTMFVLLAGLLLGSRAGALSQCVYLLLGLCGAPVFAGFTGGVGVLLGPTGGFLVGFIPAALLCGLAAELRPAAGAIELFAYCLIASAAIHLCGVSWLIISCRLSLSAAVAVGVLPFLPGDCLKAAACALLAVKMRRHGFSRQ